MNIKEIQKMDVKESLSNIREDMNILYGQLQCRHVEVDEIEEELERLWRIEECAQGQEMRARVAETQLALAVAALMKIAVGNYNWVWELAFETLENIKDVEET